MCCCDKPTINGEIGYKWQPEHAPHVHPVNPPELQEGDVLLYDEPGRCGGLDSHCHHYRVVERHGSLNLLVRHGGGDERLRVSLYKQQKAILAGLDSHSRYWMLNAIYRAHADGSRDARDRETGRWSQAAIDKRIKVRRRKHTVEVSILPKAIEQPPAATAAP